MRISIMSVNLFRERGGRGRSAVPAIAGMLFASCLALGGVAGSATAVAEEGLGSEILKVDRGGYVYAMTNDSSNNEIVVYFRDPAGRLNELPGARVSTGGAGGSDIAPISPLGSQASLVHSASLDLLIAVNAGDNTVTAFDTRLGPQPKRTVVTSSGGLIPVSVAFSEDVLYVLNAGGSGTIATFAVTAGGHLELLATYDLGLNNGGTSEFNQTLAPGQVIVDALARHVLVVNAGGQALLTVRLDDAGIPDGPSVSTPTPGVLPFATEVTRFGNVLVAEAASGSVSAFDVQLGSAALLVTAGAVPSNQGASCWIVVHDEGYAYVSNTASNTISAFRYTRTGQLQLLESVAATTSVAPTDLVLAGRGRYLYSLDAGSGQISGFRVDAATGELTAAESQAGLPASAGIQGIAAKDF